MPEAVAAAVKRVVVADDTAFVRDRFKSALEAAGHDATVVGGATDLLAWVKAHAREIDLVVLDLRLPYGRGPALVRALRAIDGFHASVVVFSGTIANGNEVRQLASLGVDGYVNEYTASQHIVPSLTPHLFPERHHQRSSPRVVTGISVSYRVENTIVAALALNIGCGGLAIRTTSPPPVGTIARVRFRLPGGKKDIDADCEVRWTDRRFGMGLRFTRIETSDQAAVDEFVHSYFFTNRKA